MTESHLAAAPRRASARADFVQGLRDIMPLIVATVPFGMVFGALAVKEGMPVDQTLLMSGLVYAGASQFVALQFWTHPLPFWTIFLSVVAVNLRHVLYSAALGRKLGHWSPLQRWLGFALLVDPIFALSELRGGRRLSAAYYFGLAVPMYFNWLASTAAGAIAGNLIPNPEAIGLDFVVTAYFIYLVVGFRKRPHAIPVILASAAGSVLVYLTAGSPWHFAGGAAAGMAVAAVLATPKESAT